MFSIQQEKWGRMALICLECSVTFCLFLLECPLYFKVTKDPAHEIICLLICYIPVSAWKRNCFYSCLWDQVDSSIMLTNITLLLLFKTTATRLFFLSIKPFSQKLTNRYQLIQALKSNFNFKNGIRTQF